MDDSEDEDEDEDDETFAWSMMGRVASTGVFSVDGDLNKVQVMRMYVIYVK